jgi:ATP-binding cassette subfamily C (CFTR/MRP) protein 10
MWQHATTTRGKNARLFFVVLRFMRGLLGVCTLAMMFQSLLLMTTPMMVRKLVQCISGEDSPEIGYATAGLLTIVTALCAVIQQYSWHMSSRCAMQVWLALTGLIFEKPARLSSGARSDITEGQLVSLMSQDSQQVLNFMSFYSLVVSAPVYIIVSSIALAFLMGWPFLIGFAVVFVSTAACDRIASKQKTLYMKKMMMADGRNSCLNESFQGIRTVKLNAWETVMESRVQKARNKEVGVVGSIHTMTAIHLALSNGLPQLGIVGSFIAYVLNGGELDAALIFACVAFFQFLVM